jgi:hypothetical protein
MFHSWLGELNVHNCWQGGRLDVIFFFQSHHPNSILTITGRVTVWTPNSNFNLIRRSEFELKLGREIGISTSFHVQKIILDRPTLNKTLLSRYTIKLHIYFAPQINLKAIHGFKGWTQLFRIEILAPVEKIGSDGFNSEKYTSLKRVSSKPFEDSKTRPHVYGSQFPLQWKRSRNFREIAWRETAVVGNQKIWVKTEKWK